MAPDGVLCGLVADERVTADTPAVALWPVVTETEKGVPGPVTGLETEVETCAPPEVWTELEAPTGPVSGVEVETETCALPPCSDAPTWVDSIRGAEVRVETPPGPTETELCADPTAGTWTLVETPSPEWELPLPADTPTPLPTGRGTPTEMGGSAGALTGGSPAAAAWPVQKSSAASAPAPADPASSTPRPALLVRPA